MQGLNLGLSALGRGRKNSVTPWWRADGAAQSSCVAAYKAKNADSLTASLNNLVNPGQYLLTASSGLIWDTTGWTCDGSHYLYLNISITSGWSMICMFSNLSPGGSSRPVCGVNSPNSFHIYPCFTDGAAYYRNGGSSTVASGGYLSGVTAIAGQQGYKNGVAHGSTIPFGSLSGTAKIALGAESINGTLSGTNVKIQAFALYNTALSASQVAAISTAMNAL